jgi:probable phosphomutase (TIGR03848 family)
MAPTRRHSPPPLTVVLFVRHGKTPTTGSVLPGRARGLHLSDEGLAQASDAARRIEAVANVGAVYCSPLERTRETASPIARAFRLRPRVERGLIECDFGDWTGAELKKLMKLPEWTTVQRYPSGFTFPGGESFSDMQARMADTVTLLCDRHPGETIVAVSHADPIKAAVASALGTHLDLFQRIMIAPCSVTAVAYGAAGPAVLAVNATATIGELRKPKPDAKR